MSRNLNTWNEFWTNQVLIRQNVVGRWRVGGGYQVLLGRWLMIGILKIECTRVLHESLLVPVLTYGSETMIWREKERSRIRAV